jgi:hypothetical protein
MDVVLGVAELAGPQGPSGPKGGDEETMWDRNCPVTSGYSYGARVYAAGPPAGYVGMDVGPPCNDPDCGPYPTPSNFCDFYHFWSNHSGGALFCMADGSVHFLSYSMAQATLNALSTRAGGETPDMSGF